MTQLQLHPLCTLFPRIEGAEFKALVSDIAQNGLREPITTHDGMILDGGNRYRACLEAGVAPHFQAFRGGNIVSFVLSCNLHRRHMTAPQQAAIVASAQNWATAAGHGGSVSSVPGNTRPDTVADRAAVSGASIMTQRRADAVAKADPEVAKQVAHGQKSLSQAVREVAPEMSSRPASRPVDPVPADPVAPPKLLSKATVNQSSDVGELHAELESLRAQLAEARDNARELADSLQASMTLEEGQEATAKELKRLYGLVSTLESQRDQYMTKCNQLIATVRAKDRQIAKLEKKSA